MKRKGLGVSPLTNRIYYGTKDTQSQKFTGAKTDVTEDAIAAVFQWFMGQMEDDMKEYSITYKGTDFDLIMRRKD